MQYVLMFLEGIITFVSPCILPMLPLYISYFAASGLQDDGKYKALKNSIGFVIGFTMVFITLGAFAGTLGRLLREYDTAFNWMTGLIVIVFGLNFLGVIKIEFLNRTYKMRVGTKEFGFFSSMLFGIVFSVGWTPCVGAFLGSALMLASLPGSALQGSLMLLLFSLGLGIPFIASALLITKLKSTFDFIKRNYRIINIISGMLLIVMGILMVTGYMGYFLTLLTL